MSLDVFHFLTEPAFVLSWYGFGAVAAIWVLYDTLALNRHVTPVLKGAWPIIVLFFSVVALALYFWTCRPPKIGSIQARSGDERAQEVHYRYVDKTWKKVVGSDIHCVGGDGLGIMSAMVVTRLLEFSFWPEFATEYLVGFLFGWIAFQAPAMHQMGETWPASFGKGGRAEFISMMTVMLGMGLIMRFVTLTVVGHPPKPDTAAFWGFAALGLMVGFVFTYPMNWWLVKIGWKHGMA